MDACVDAFQSWVKNNFNVEDTKLIEVLHSPPNITTIIRIWPNREKFQVGDLLVGALDPNAGNRTLYKVLACVGTLEHPYYDVRIVACCCPGNDYDDLYTQPYCVNKIGTILRHQAGNYFLKATPKEGQHVQSWFHCDDTHVEEEDWPPYP